MPDGVSHLCHTGIGKLARPARLELATSWFVVVTPVIDQVRSKRMKIRRLIDLRARNASSSTTVDHGGRPSLNGVTSHSTSQLDDPAVPLSPMPALVHHELAQAWVHMVLLRQEVTWT